jgi:hypothetical protein
VTNIDINKLEALREKADRGFIELHKAYKSELFLSAPALIAEIRRLRAIEAAAKTWMEWGGHCPTCAFVRHREGNPLLSTELLWDYCDCGWHAASAALAAKGNEK